MLVVSRRQIRFPLDSVGLHSEDTNILASGLTLFIVVRDDIVEKEFCVTGRVSQLLSQ